MKDADVVGDGGTGAGLSRVACWAVRGNLCSEQLGKGNLQQSAKCAVLYCTALDLWRGREHDGPGPLSSSLNPQQ